jgi:hypothetical protein
VADTLLDWLAFILRHRGQTFAVISPDQDTTQRHVIDPMRRALPEYVTVRRGERTDVRVLDNRIVVINENQARGQYMNLRGYSFTGVWVDPLAYYDDHRGQLVTTLSPGLVAKDARVFHGEALGLAAPHLHPLRCSHCGAPTEVEVIDISTAQDLGRGMPRYMHGRAECTAHCQSVVFGS